MKHRQDVPVSGRLSDHDQRISFQFFRTYACNANGASPIGWMRMISSFAKNAEKDRGHPQRRQQEPWLGSNRGSPWKPKRNGKNERKEWR